MNILKWLFGEPAPEPHVVIGQRYTLNSEQGNPFATYVATVDDVKNGWVQYTINNVMTSSMKEKSFLSLYTLIK